MAGEEEKKDGLPTNGKARIASSSVLGHTVYVRSEDHGWVPARVIRMDEEHQEAVVAIDRCDEEQEMLLCGTGKEVDTFTVDLKAYPGHVLPLQNTDDSGKLKEYEDMTDLLYLHEVRHWRVFIIS
jgi:hypothetical protein